MADFNEALRINPNFADTYYNRGIAFARQRNKKGAVADFQKAATLYQQQGNQESYKAVQKLVEQLKR
jgi:tetratricopeptide (TPR) repeat protein